MTMMLPYGILSGNPLVGEWKQSLDEGKGLFTGAGDGPYPSTTREEALIRAFLPDEAVLIRTFLSPKEAEKAEAEASVTLKYTKKAQDDAKRILYQSSISRIRELLPDWYEALTNQLLTGATYVDNALEQVYAKLEDPKFANLFRGPDILPVRKRLLGWFPFIKGDEVGTEKRGGEDKSLFQPVLVNVAVLSNPDDDKSSKLDFTAKDPPFVLLVPYGATIAGLPGLGRYATVWEYLMTAAVRSYGIWSQSVLVRNLAHVTHNSLVNLRLADPGSEIEAAQQGPVTLLWAPRTATEPYATIPAKKPSAVAASVPGLEVKPEPVPPLERIPDVQPGIGLGGQAPGPAAFVPFGSFRPFAETASSSVSDLTRIYEGLAAQEHPETKRAVQQTGRRVADATAQHDTLFATASHELKELAAEVKATETKSAAGREEAKVLEKEGELIQQGRAILDQLTVDYAAYLDQSRTVAAYLRSLLPQLTELAVRHQGVETHQKMLREFLAMPEAKQAIPRLLPSLTGTIQTALNQSNVGQRTTIDMVNDLATAVKAFGIKMDRENADATSADKQILREDAQAFRDDVDQALQLGPEGSEELAAEAEWKIDEPQPGQAPHKLRGQPYIYAFPRSGRPGPGQAPVGPTKVERDVTAVVDKIQAKAKPSLDDWHTLLVDGLHLDFDAKQGKWAKVYALIMTNVSLSSPHLASSFDV